jgi:hypothetical protein
MAYNNYFPQQYYPQYYGNQQIPQNAPNLASNAQQQINNSIIWVQGEAAAKAYPVASGQSVQLMDSEESVFYIKSTDQSGMPQPLRVFEYKERTSNHGEPAVAKNNNVDFVSRAEFEEFREDVKRSIKGLRKPKTEEEGEG